MKSNGEYKDCEVCGKSTYFTPARLRKTRNFTCSKKCMGINFSKLYSQKIKTNCYNCGKEILYKQSHFREIAYPSCSSKCFGELRSIFYQKDNNPNSLKLNDLERFFWERNKELRRRAKAGNKPFNLDYKYLLDLYNKQEGKCFYSGIKMKLKSTNKKGIDFNVLSVDKIDPDKGYIKNNVVFCLNCVNMFKSNHKLEDIKSVIEGLYERTRNY